MVLMGDYSKRDVVVVAEHIERRTRAMELKSAGWTYQQISDELGYGNRGNAYKDIQKGLDVRRNDEGEMADRLRTVQDMRLEEMYKAVYPQAVGQTTRDGQPNLRAVDTLLKIMERQSRLHGLDAPIKQELAVTTNLDERVEELLKALGLDGTPPPTIQGEILGD